MPASEVNEPTNCALNRHGQRDRFYYTWHLISFQPVCGMTENVCGSCHNTDWMCRYGTFGQNCLSLPETKSSVEFTLFICLNC